MPNFGDNKLVNRAPYTYGTIKAGSGSLGKWFLIDTCGNTSTIDRANLDALNAQGGGVTSRAGAGTAHTSRPMAGTNQTVTFIFSVGGQARKCTTQVLISTDTWSIINNDQLANTNARLGGPDNFSPGGGIFTGLLNDPYAADTHENWVNT